jgi:hypothetical protein
MSKLITSFGALSVWAAVGGGIWAHPANAKTAANNPICRFTAISRQIRCYIGVFGRPAAKLIWRKRFAENQKDLPQDRRKRLLRRSAKRRSRQSCLAVLHGREKQAARPESNSQAIGKQPASTRQATGKQPASSQQAASKAGRAAQA